MRVLNLNGNHVSDISVISNLTGLEELNLGDNIDITNIGSLKGLSKLTWLNLSNSQIADITPLLKLNNLTYLNLEGVNLPKKDLERLSSSLPNCDIKI